jgi:hypothetical protein
MADTATDEHLDAQGWSVRERLLSPAECTALTSLYDEDRWFRSTVTMARHGYGAGEYKYFRYPLPATVETLRQALYANLVPLANRWMEQMSRDTRYPATLAEFLARCHEAGQNRPTPLILRYDPGGYNSLHQDLYGDHVFPLQAAVLLSRPAVDFSGGEFVLTEQRPRRQGRATVVPLSQGDAVVFAVHHRPVGGARGFYRVSHRHGVSTLLAGRRHTLGIIFHDAA